MIEERFRKVIDETDGCVGILVFSYEGFLTDEYWGENEKDAAEYVYALSFYAPVVKLAVENSKENRLGEVLEITLQTTEGIFLLRPVDSEVFIAMVMNSNGNVGRGRFQLNEAAFHLFQAALN